MLTSGKCTHNFFRNQAVSFCKSCGVFKYTDKFGVDLMTCKTTQLNYFCEMDPLKMYEVMRKEKFTCDFQSQTRKDYLNSRTQVVEMIFNFGKFFDFGDNVTFLATHYADLILSADRSKNHELTGKVAACDRPVPKYSKLLPYLSQNYTVTDLKNYELLCLKSLDYKTDHYTAYSYLEYFIRNGFVFEDEANTDSSMDEMYSTPFKILNLFVNDKRYCDFSPIEISMAVIQITRKLFKLSQSCSELLEAVYQVDRSGYRNCYFVLKILLDNLKTENVAKQSPTIHRPYSARHFGNDNLEKKFYNYYNNNNFSSDNLSSAEWYYNTPISGASFSTMSNSSRRVDKDFLNENNHYTRSERRPIAQGSRISYYVDFPNQYGGIHMSAGNISSTPLNAYSNFLFPSAHVNKRNINNFGSNIYY